MQLVTDCETNCCCNFHLHWQLMMMLLLLLLLLMMMGSNVILAYENYHGPDEG